METPKSKTVMRSSSPRRAAIECSTPVGYGAYGDSQIIDDYSPLFLPTTQECLGSVDVMWDWNSPQSKPKSPPPRKPKRLYRPKSPPRIPAVSHDTSAFNKLKVQLETFKAQLKLSSNNNNNAIPADSPLKSRYRIGSPRNLMTKSFSSESLGGISMLDDIDLNTSLSTTKANKSLNQFTHDDSLDVAMEAFLEEDYELLSQGLGKPTVDTIKQCSNNSSTDGDKVQNVSDISNKIKDVETPAASTSCLESMKNTTSSFATIKDLNSKRQYSPEEIEKKRQMAMAKLKEKKIQEQIQRNRQEALKRLENSRRKNGLSSAPIIKRYNST